MECSPNLQIKRHTSFCVVVILKEKKKKRKRKMQPKNFYLFSSFLVPLLFFLLLLFTQQKYTIKSEEPSTTIKAVVSTNEIPCMILGFLSKGCDYYFEVSQTLSLPKPLPSPFNGFPRINYRGVAYFRVSQDVYYNFSRGREEFYFEGRFIVRKMILHERMFNTNNKVVVK
jgi:hypothetical protein